MGELIILISLIAAEGSGMCSPRGGNAPSFRIQTASQTLLGAAGMISAGNTNLSITTGAQGSERCCWGHTRWGRAEKLM